MILDEFKTYLQAKDYVVIVYWTNVRIFLRYCESKKIDYLTISPLDYQAFVASLKEKKLFSETINSYIKAVRCFYKFLLVSQKINEKQCEIPHSIPMFRVDRKIRNYFTKEELDDIIEMGMDFVEKVPPLKLKTLLLFMYYTGLRKNEIIHLKREDIDTKLRQAIVRVPTKNRIERTVFFPRFLAKLLDIYFGSEPEQENAFNLTANRLIHLVKTLQEFSPHKHFSIHTLRHSFGRLLASNQIDIRVAQKLLGHKSINTTTIYYDPDIDIIKRIYDNKITGQNRKAK